jgi:hypothetical protein
MIPIKDIDVALALKLGDPAIDTGNGDGNIFTRENRLHYISRAYGKLLRIVTKLMDGNLPFWAKQKVLHSINGVQYDGKDIDLGLSVREIESVFVSYNAGTLPSKPNILVCTNVQATYKRPEEYLNILHGVNTITTPSFVDKKIFFTFLNNSLQLLPIHSILNNENHYYAVQYICLPDTAVYGIDDKLPITYDYLDILINLAAIEGSMDIANQVKYQLYQSEVNGQLQILSQYSQIEKQEKGNRVDE